MLENNNWLNEIFDPANYPEPISAIDELAAINHWVAWRYEQRGEGNPTKPPKNPRTGFGASHSDPNTWGTYDQAAQCAKARGWPGKPYVLHPDDSITPGTGFVLTEEDGYTGIDLDHCVDKDTGVVDSWALEILDLAETYAEYSPSGTGIRMILRGKAIEAAVKRDDIGVEIYRSQRYLTLTGRHICDTPEDIQPAPKTIAALLARCEATTPPKHEPVPGKSLAHRQKPLDGEIILPSASDDPGSRAYAERALELNARELAAHPRGGRNNTLYKKAFRMGTMAARGWIDRATVHSALLDACHANGYVKDKGRKSFEDSFRSGFNGGLQKPHDDLPEREGGQGLDEWIVMIDRMVDGAGGPTLIEGEDGALYDKETGEVIETAAPPNSAKHELPDHLTRPAGLLGEIVDWITDSAIKPNRVLSLGAAIAAMGTIIGRRVAGPTTSGTHLYIVALGLTGCGKDHPQKRSLALVKVANENLASPSGEFMSQTALVNHVTETPLSLVASDEVGVLLEKACNPRASSFERAITKSLREYWGSSFEEVAGIGRAASKGDAIKWPALSLFGVSTHDEFFNAMSSKEVTNGFLNRWLMLSTVAKTTYAKKPAASKFKIPDEIQQRIVELYQDCRGDEACGQTLPEERIARRCNEYWQIVIDWESDEVCDEWESLREFCDNKSEDSELGGVYVRTAEMALRLATVHAVSRAGLDAKVTHEDFAWGRELAMWSANTMAREVAMRMADTPAQARANLVLRIITEAGRPITQREITRKLKNKLTPKERNDAFDILVDGETVLRSKTQPKNGGPVTYTYLLKGAG
ncbi:MAG: hypothetical protein EKK29_05930 [Hyphomicrobiales bacterium]|nr:MAG: hypothetical protein EKK29_05930 [Hyphomicrobiales bacterium]